VVDQPLDDAFAQATIFESGDMQYNRSKRIMKPRRDRFAHGVRAFAGLLMLIVVPATGQSQGQAGQVTLTSVSPASFIAGSANVDLSVRGSGFAEASQLRINGHQRSTTFVSENELRAQLRESDLASAGSLAVTVFTPSRGTSNTVALVVQAGSATPAPVSPPPASPPPDTEPPRLSAPANTGSLATSSAGATVWYTAPVATDNSGAVIPVTCTPPSGSTFPIGTTTVVCTARDAAGNTASVSFSITVVSPYPVIPAQPPKATTLEIASTTPQLAAAGANVSSAPSIKVRDQNNNVMPNVTVAFAVSSGGGTVTPATVATNASGVAQATSWRLGTAPGANSVTATVGNLASLTFNATGVLVATAVQAASPASVTWSPAAAVPQPPAVIVRDQFGNPLPNTNVSFAVTSGGGSISPTTQMTGIDGGARLTIWTLGPDVGTNKVAATVSGVSPVEFTATVPFTLVVFVKRTDGTALANSQVCVGSRTDVDQFATVKDAGTFGRESFRVPVAAEYAITASKGSFTGQTAYLTRSGNSGAVTVTLPGGTGGPICPGASSVVDATSSTPLPADPLPDLDVRVTQSSSPLIGGTRQTYIVKAHNRGGQTASAIVVRNSISSNLTFLLVDANKGFVCTRSGTTINCPSGVLAAHDSATIRIETWLSSATTSGHDILFGAKADPGNTIPESNETNNEAAAATVTQAAARLTEEFLTTRGIVLGDASVTTQLDCKQFGDSLVMVGIRGTQSDPINHIQVGCSTMKAPGTLGTSVRWTSGWYDDNAGGNAFNLQCPRGWAVSGGEVTLRRESEPYYDGEVRSLSLHCKAVGTSGLTSGIEVILAPAGRPTTTKQGPDSCTQGRPARGLKVSASLEGLFGSLISAETLICAQPVIP
jgi:uncharacterized repeat protein (TIGR01451 family)